MNKSFLPELDLPVVLFLMQAEALVGVFVFGLVYRVVDSSLNFSKDSFLLFTLFLTLLMDF